MGYITDAKRATVVKQELLNDDEVTPRHPYPREGFIKKEYSEDRSSPAGGMATGFHGAIPRPPGRRVSDDESAASEARDDSHDVDSGVESDGRHAVDSGDESAVSEDGDFECDDCDDSEDFGSDDDSAPSS